MAVEPVQHLGCVTRRKSFHQTQRFRSGIQACVAIDYVCRNGTNVHRAPRTGELPIQGSLAALVWGIHANVGVPGHRGWESWHAQPVEMDGFATWVRQGRPDPQADYPILGHHSSVQPIATPKHPTREETDMIIVDLNPGTDYWVAMLVAGNEATHLENGHHVAVLERGHVPRVKANETEVAGVLESVHTTNASPFHPGSKAHNAHLDGLWDHARHA